VQEGKLFMLQTRGGKRVGQAAVKIAVDMVDEGLVETSQAIMMVRPEHLNQLLHPQFKESTSSKAYKGSVLSSGLPASPGAAVGKIVFTSEKAEAESAAGQDCILVRDDTSPEDVGGMWSSKGVLTARGGMTSHAAVVARGWGKTCICGCGDLKIDYEAGTMTLGGVTLKEGDFLSLNGDSGEVLAGKLELKPPSLASGEIRRFMKWVDDKRTIKVLTNADTPEDALEARRNGAQGIGLSRTEHMFFSPDRINVVRRMILAADDKQRQVALDELLPFQRSDFEGMLEAMDGLPVTIRLLDPPLHEFLPPVENIDEAFAAEMGLSHTACVDAVSRLEEVNPMLGLRGCRLGIRIPELVQMQVRALFEAAVANLKKGLDPRPEIMVPLVGSVSEFVHQRDIIRDVATKVFEESGKRVQYKIGTMIEVPRAALVAGELAEAGAEFFSYGTNDLTQMTYGFSRDDVGTFLPNYIKLGVLDRDPFINIDERGVGQLIKMSAAEGKRSAIHRIAKAGVCGEHGGDPASIRFFVRAGLDYISCSPSRLPVARLAAAQCTVEDEKKAKTLALTQAVEAATKISEESLRPK
jgi:pyruvate,orthophosphate dikinase